MMISLWKRINTNWPAKVVSFALAVLLYFFAGLNSLEERFITVTVELSLPDQLMVLNRSFTRVAVTIRGTTEEVWNIREDDILIQADFSDIQDEGIFRKPLSISRAGLAATLEGIEIIPEQGIIQVELQQVAQQRVRIVPELRGLPAIGYQIGMLQVIPQEITVVGPRSLVDEITTVSTVAVDLSGRTQDFAQQAEIALPDSRLRVLETRQVDVRIGIEEAVVLTTFSGVDIIVLGIPEDLVLDTAPPTGEIRVQGAQLVLEQVRNDQVRITTDASVVQGPGRVVLRTRPEVPAGILVLRYDPVEIELEFLERPNFNQDQED